MTIKSIITVITVFLIFTVSVALAFDFGWRISPDPNPLPLKPWTPSYSFGLLQSSTIMPLGTFQSRLVSDPPPLTWTETFSQCFVVTPAEQLSNPDDFIFQPGFFQSGIR